jgi:hypothetical protein
MRSYIAVAPDSLSNSIGAAAANDFISWITNSPSYSVNETIFQYFSSEQAIIDHISNSFYAIDSKEAILSAAIIFKSSAPSWEYTLRFNKTLYDFDGPQMPDTSANDLDLSVRYKIDLYHFI